jgi:hypothetical protein
MESKEINTEHRNEMFRNIQTVLQSLTAALVIAAFGFLWNINGAVIQMRTEGTFRDKALEDATEMLKEIQKNLQSIESRVQYLESLKNKK